MKSNLFLLSLIFFIFFSCDKDPINTSCLPQSLEKNIIAFYPFSAGSLTDFSKNKNTLSNNKASFATDRAGNLNCAYSFKKVDSSFLKTKGSFTNNFHKSSFSISLWFKHQGIRDPGDSEDLIVRSKNDNSRILPNWSLGLGDCRIAEFSVTGKFLRDGTLNCEESVFDLSGKWQHLVCTFDGDKMELYRNGIRSNRIQDASPFGPSFINTGDIFIGLDYTGIIDDVIIFNKTLSASEVATLYKLEPCCG
jgi:hypothetical protein